MNLKEFSEKLANRGYPLDAIAMQAISDLTAAVIEEFSVIEEVNSLEKDSKKRGKKK